MPLAPANPSTRAWAGPPPAKWPSPCNPSRNHALTTLGEIRLSLCGEHLHPLFRVKADVGISDALEAAMALCLGGTLSWRRWARHRWTTCTPRSLHDLIVTQAGGLYG
ncbi:MULTISPECIES: DUF3077 domain-containing protein [unclassified Pseudomonas]|uniref:DUF3077 domain-containing protein n=1 Tax=unclassified Pseudomonas TaxID=196821 RepID=UPI0021ADC500|nr:DUF3077 domain-containing protein [Pseudomonas sp. MSSRFD41]